MSKSRNIADIGSNDVLDTNANGIDVTGTVTADGILSQDGTSGATASTNADQLVIDSSTRGGLSILTPNNTLGEIYFGDPENNNIGRIWYDHSNDSMSFRTNAAERMRIDSSGTLLVGKSSTGLSVNGTQINSDGRVMFTRDGFRVIDVNRKTSDGDIIGFFKDGTLVGSIGVVNTSEPYFADSSSTYDAGIRLKAHATFNMVAPCDNVGAFTDGALDFGYSGGRFRNLYLSGGVYLGGTGAANKLDDYEEGTFTATITTSGGSVTIGSQTCQYAKVGRVVVLNGFISVSGISSPSGQFTITGLPFTPSINGTGGANVNLQNLNSTTATSIFAEISTNPRIYIAKSTTLSSLSDAADLLSSSTLIKFGATYQVA